MKRLSTSIAALALGTLFISSVSFAGINYNEYRADFLSQNGPQKSEQKSFEHKSPTQREEPKEMKAPQKENTNQAPGKYDRSNWAPNQ